MDRTHDQLVQVNAEGQRNYGDDDKKKKAPPPPEPY